MKVAVVGATGAVGKELISILEARNFPVTELVPFASARSEGKAIELGGKSYRCQTLKKGCFDGIDIAFFDASDAVSKEWSPQAAESGAWVVDNSATFRLDDDILLLVPEVNGELLKARLKKGVKNLSPRERILTGPNCSTVQMVVALKPIRDQWGIKRVVVSTYQSTSGAGAAAMDELSAQTAGVVARVAANGRLDNLSPVPPKAFAHQIAFNCIPHIGGFQGDGYTSEEHKMVAESRKLLQLPALRISATAVRVPTFACHGESINVECERPVTADEARAALKAQPGIVLQDEPAQKTYPMSMPGETSHVEGAAGRDAVYVGRVRQDPSLESGLNLWVVSDNLRKGAALNAIQIGEMLVKSIR
jgi:aspartate-semialdehyde dehydrogenase